MGRKRKTNKHLPKRLYPHGKKWRYHHKDGRKTTFTDFTDACTFAAKENAGLNNEVQTIAQLLERYAHEVLPTKPKQTQLQRKSSIKRLTKVFGHMSAGSVTTQHIYQYLDARADKPSAANMDVSVFSHVFTKAIRWGIVTVNPCSGVEKHKTKPRTRYVTDEEFWQVHALANERLKIAMELSLLTGLRPGDISSLTRDNLTDAGILVTPSKTKGSTGVALLIEWSDELHDVIRRAKKLKPEVRKYLVCNSKGQKYTPVAFSRAFSRLMSRAESIGVAHFQFRDIRAKSASDDTLEEASKRLGHSSTDITQRVYVRTPRSVKPLR